MLEYREHEEKVNFLYIEGINLDGGKVLIAQASSSYTQGSQTQLSFHVFDEKLYDIYKEEIEEKVAQFRLKYERQTRRTEFVLYGLEKQQEILKDVFDDKGNKIGFITLYDSGNEYNATE